MFAMIKALIILNPYSRKYENTLNFKVNTSNLIW